jgi:hypothetical protein
MTSVPKSLPAIKPDYLLNNFRQESTRGDPYRLRDCGPAWLRKCELWAVFSVLMLVFSPI